MQNSKAEIANSVFFIFRQAILAWGLLHCISLLPDGLELLGKREFFSAKFSDTGFSFHRIFSNQIWENYWQVIVSIYCALTLAMLSNRRAHLAWPVYWILTLNLNSRCPEVLDGGNNLSELLIFYALFSVPSDWIAHRSALLLSKCALMLSQLQICFVYLTAGWAKVMGHDWQSGTALYYIFQNLDFSTELFSEIVKKNIWISVVGTYFALGFQTSFPFLIWWKPTRRFMILLGLFLHLGISITLGLPTFGLIMCLSYLLFLNSSDLKIITDVLHSRNKVYIAIDSDCELCKKIGKLLSFLDVSRVLIIDDARNPNLESFQELPIYQRLSAMAVCEVNQKSQLQNTKMGFSGIEMIFKNLPLLVPLLPVFDLLHASNFGHRLYGKIANNRQKLGCGQSCTIERTSL